MLFTKRNKTKIDPDLRLLQLELFLKFTKTHFINFTASIWRWMLSPTSDSTTGLCFDFKWQLNGAQIKSRYDRYFNLRKCEKDYRVHWLPHIARILRRWASLKWAHQSWWPLLVKVPTVPTFKTVDYSFLVSFFLLYVVYRIPNTYQEHWKCIINVWDVNIFFA